MEQGDEPGRPVALATFAVLAVLGFFATLVLGAFDVTTPVRVQQPNPAIAAAIEDDLSGLPGVQNVEISNTIECVDGCEQSRHIYTAEVDLQPDVTPVQISEIVSTHDTIAPSRVGLSDLPISFQLSPEKTMSVASVHYGFGVTQAEAYLTAVDASSKVAVAYGPPAAGESPLLTISADLQGLVCANADAAISQVMPVISSAAAVGGIPFGTVRFDCGAAKLEAGIAAGAVFQPGWTLAATTIDRLCREQACGTDTGVLQDLFVSFEDASTTVTVTLNDGQDLTSSQLGTVQGIVDALTNAGAANPRLDLDNY